MQLRVRDLRGAGGHLSIYERSSPATDTILHDAVNYFT